MAAVIQPRRLRTIPPTSVPAIRNRPRIRLAPPVESVGQIHPGTEAKARHSARDDAYRFGLRSIGRRVVGISTYWSRETSLDAPLTPTITWEMPLWRA